MIIPGVLLRKFPIAVLAALSTIAGVSVQAQINLIARGTLTRSTAGDYADLSGLDNTLENGVKANLLGGFGSGITHVSGDLFLAVPDRGPNAHKYNRAVDDTTSYIDRFHTIKMNLRPSKSSGLPYVITPELERTTLLWSATPLVYGSGAGLSIGSGRPDKNDGGHYYMTGRSDNFDPNKNSGDSNDARLDPEGIRLANDGSSVFISDEYGPYIYQFDRMSGKRLRSYTLPEKYYVSKLSPSGSVEISDNVSGRTANKGMEGLALTPDGKTLVGIMQASLIQDAKEGGAAATMLRIVMVDVKSGQVTHEYAYDLGPGTGVSEFIALNNHEFLVDERDSKGLADKSGSEAKIKLIFKIDLDGATDVSKMDGKEAAANAVKKTVFLDIVKVLTANGMTGKEIPAKIEGLAFGPVVEISGVKMHTLWVANDNDFEQDFEGEPNPNQFFVFGFTDKDLGGSKYVPQERSGLLE
jgi:Esterase-like activity of phytase